MAQVIVIGAGIVGLATAHELTRRGHEVTVLEKEPDVARHQTGRNSGVIHSGLYYAPGSLKARMGAAGAVSMRDFAVEHGIGVEICGKLVVATRESQVPALEKLLARGLANGAPVRRVDQAEAREYEPHVACVAALRVDTTGIVDYVGVCRTLARLIADGGGRLATGAEIVAIDARADGVTVTTPAGEFRADRLVNCAGLQADRVARLAGLEPDVRIVPFRGEYFVLAPSAQHLVNGLIYPVPDPTLPFLGVHLTKMIGGGVHAGPNAVLALARDGYAWRTISPRDIGDYLAWPGLWRLGRRFWKTGAAEVVRSMSQRRFLASLRELVPDLPDGCLTPAPAGVRAQALRRDGAMVDDFDFLRADRQIHVLNAPSPAATASLEIGRSIADEVDLLRGD
ncbi:L-2-hydroxyglutarate oxidase [Tessaracoccus palaemonis]|uniref:L-2-hydroxyglutarate oxidase n=1 Tax=Tessaracoccus palaemonis TaxID=2829499 RepID=A0ABX8SNM6_9ACTN|nr:L-2-hydroxyglutarate oxidase [Tessaracoccus palaemonis]QXT64022.1 L-2-hydroxyglutarate oxidase [Tessaracoccus palaemonis]